MDDRNPNDYFQRYLDSQFKTVFARLDALEQSVQGISDAIGRDAVTISELKGRIVLICSLAGTAIAAVVSGIISFVFRGGSK